MIYAIPMLVAAISAAFFCSLIARTFSSLRNRACYTVCIACPVLLAALLLALSGALLNPLYEFLQGLHMLDADADPLIVIVGSALVVITLLVANLIAQIRILNRRGLDTK